jgi:hypothetical protein
MCAYSPCLTDPARCTHRHHERLIASIDVATTTATEGAPAAVPVTRPARQNSLSAETLEVLEKRLAQRPDRQELQDRNILKGAPGPVRVLCMLFVTRTHADVPNYYDGRSCLTEGNVAPALQAAREQLQRSQLEVCDIILTPLPPPPAKKHRSLNGAMMALPSIGQA